VRLVILVGLAIDQIAQSGLSSLSVIYYSAQLFSPATGITAFKFAIFIFTCLVAKHAVLQNCTCHKSIGTDNTRILPGHLPAKFLNSLSRKRIHTTPFYQQ
ncbi:hypothetical protein ACLBQU_10965, partial [Klebsiella pneumoniae]|uniref:hypothetical protein n=1 Tax=Klebsiella pneumoniae TaxID=573 RepID=UPI003968DF4A